MFDVLDAYRARCREMGIPSIEGESDNHLPTRPCRHTQFNPFRGVCEDCGLMAEDFGLTHADVAHRRRSPGPRRDAAVDVHPVG